MIFDKRLLYISKAASTDFSSQEIHFVKIEDNTAVATNGHIMFWADFDTEQKLEYESSIPEDKLVSDYIVNPELIKMAFKISANNSKRDLAALNKISIRAKIDMVEIYARSRGNDYFLRHKLEIGSSWIYPNWYKVVDKFKDTVPVDKISLDANYLKMVSETGLSGVRGITFTFHGQNNGATFTFQDSQSKTVNGLIMPHRNEE